MNLDITRVMNTSNIIPNKTNLNYTINICNMQYMYVY